jgi:peptide/nickel transport system permease protein
VTAVAPPLEGLTGSGRGRVADRRTRTIVTAGATLAALVIVVMAGTLAAGSAAQTDLGARNLSPSVEHPFGTDRLGRDQLARTLAGLRLSLLVGTLAAAVSAAIALVLGAAAGALGRRVDAVVGWMVDLVMALPHLVLLILLAFVLGGGMKAVVIAVAVTHWPSLTRVLRGEARRVAASDYVAVSRRLGRGGTWIGRHHLVPHLVPHFSVGLVLLFPHAILHESALSFLGLGLSPHEPAIGILLADGMRYLSAGAWWLAVLPGLALLLIVKTVDVLGHQLRSLTDPRTVQD